MANRDTAFSGSEVLDPPQASKAGALVAAPYGAMAPAMGGFASRGPELIHGGFNQTWLVNCLRRRWLMALALGLLLGSVVAGALLWAFPPTSKVTAFLRVKSNADKSVFGDAREKLSPQEVEKQAMNHLTLLKSPMVLDAAWQGRDIRDLDAIQSHKGEELLWLQEELKVSFPGDGEILEVRYEGDEDAEQMRKIVDAIVKAYQDKVLLNERTAEASSAGDLQKVLDTLKVGLKEQLEKLEEQARAKGVFNEDVEIPKLGREITSLETRRVEAEKELVDLEVFKNMAIQTAKSPTALQSYVTAEIDKDPTLNNYRQQLFGIQQEYERRKASSRNPNDVQLKRLEAQLRQTESAMEQYRRNAERATFERMEKMPNEGLRTAMLEYAIRKKALEESLAQIDEEMLAANEKLKTLGVRDPEMEMLEGNIESEGEIISSLGMQVREAKVLQDAQAESMRDLRNSDLEKVTVLQPAVAVPNGNTERFSIAGIGGLAALALTCYGVALVEFRRRRLNNPGDIDEGLGIRVLGVLPATSLKTLAGSSLVATQVAESIDNVRATLMHDSTSRARQVVMVTSAGTQEGTSVVASSLALSLSRAGRRTLLIDADLRSPDMNKLFGMPLEGGLSEVLRSEIDLDDAIRPTNNEKLYLLTAGVCDAEAVHALATDQPQVIFDKLREQFDFVIIDAPPVLGISDALSVGQYVDGAVLTVLRDHSEVRGIHQAAELLKRMGVRLIGAVVNGVPIKADRRVVRLHQASAKRTLQLPAKSEG